jgi:glycosyltransferase involved in cell wall biosynthesis
MNKPLIIRKFAGDDPRATLGVLGYKVAELALRKAELYLAETQALVSVAKTRGIRHVEWYPNSRPVPETFPLESSSMRRCVSYVFIGRVCLEKGMRVLADAAKYLPVGVTVDVYGPWHDDLERNVFDRCPNITYRGELRPEEIIPTMRKYDASLLPTYYPGEGYPGAILESYFAGLPVIATKWQAIPEIVDDTVGILVKPKDPDDLARAITLLTQDVALFGQLRANTKDKAEFFSAGYWGRHFINLCKSLAGRCERL